MLADNSGESLQRSEQSREDGDAEEDECRQRAEQPRSGRDTEQVIASCDRPRRKITSQRTLDIYKDFICD